MRFEPTPVSGAWLVSPEPNQDARGFFERVLCLREFAGHGIRFEVVQSNLAHTTHAGVIRGLHYLPPPDREQKLVRCVAGAVHDVIVDVRQGSPTAGATFQVRLDATRRQSLFVPAGVAHGYQSLSDGTGVLYMTDTYYRPGLEKGVRYDDPSIGIAWPLPARDVTDRDLNWPLIERPAG
jgi:dTDP-4-dehydrorhamnose 3,5-epimerase